MCVSLILSKDGCYLVGVFCAISPMPFEGPNMGTVNIATRCGVSLLVCSGQHGVHGDSQHSNKVWYVLIGL